MKRIIPSLLVAMLALALFSCSDDKRDLIGKTEVVIETSRGDITVRLYDDTPVHRDNFIKMIEEGVYENIIWNRIVPGATIQSGEPSQKGGGAAPTVDPEKYRHRLPAEILYPRH
ncbi:MAG: peptidylprolyl isomerase, partial [Bacteroidaceae bacterium]|nr:peptidylprolyl isomerase [Bacteroidaceae bacterium]